MPSAKSGDVSVYRTLGLQEHEIWTIGTEFVADVRGKPLLGRADLLAGTVFAEKLSVTGTSTPHPRHANIGNWPAPERDRLLAIKLAEAATLILL